MAAVSYHFGSLKSLCDAAVKYIFERCLAAQEEAVRALGAELRSMISRPPSRAR